VQDLIGNKLGYMKIFSYICITNSLR